jgi:hypothetical protein
VVFESISWLCNDSTVSQLVPMVSIWTSAVALSVNLNTASGA